MTHAFMSNKLLSPVISCFQSNEILEATAAGLLEISTSLDLERSRVKLIINPEYALLPDGQQLTLQQLQIVRENDSACFLVRDNEIVRIQTFSEAFNRYYSLMPTNSAPTMLISGIPMHRIKDTNPHQDTLSKIKAVKPVTGQVLDTTMGLGYTAIEASRTADHVTTIELDPAILDICRQNPWSQELFDNSKITRLVGDAYDLIQEFADQVFSRVIHDPPMFSLAGDLYSTTFYEQVFRVLRSSGRLFHYIGDPKSRSGRNVTRGVVRRLQDSGFNRVKSYPQAYGVVAYK
jgi:predicted methyltransferase